MFNYVSFVPLTIIDMIIYPVPIVGHLSIDPIEPLPPTPNAPADHPCQVYLVTGWLQPHERTSTVPLTGILTLNTTSTQLVRGQRASYSFPASIQRGQGDIHFLENICKIKTSFGKDTPPSNSQGVVHFQTLGQQRI